ncbi:MAG: hypothetical protein JOY99_13350 [Sphingomonadaceae bacterium]|nr:hypothetical protein [Sphingomonadaceae bacterium]
MIVRLRGWVPIAALLLASAPAIAGPPFVTDDPEPTDTGHWENYGFVAGTHFPGETDGEAGLDINYGAAHDLQLTVGVPLEYEHRRGTHVGFGDLELGAKYRFLYQSEGSLLPDVAFFPSLSVPTATRGFGGGRVSAFLPLWAQKDFGKWSLFGGGGYTINPGRDARNFWLEGIALSRAITDAVSLGAEIYHQGRDSVDETAITGINVGGAYRFAKHWSLLGSAGPGLEHPRRSGRYSFYMALKADY